MLLSHRWLEEWVPGVPEPGALAPRLTSLGFQVESMTPRARFSGVVVGKVLECGKHPNADRLSLCKVEVGEGRVVEIVCGAPNARAGLTVAVALEGAALPGGVLRKSKIRGVVSNGMMCSSRELELSEEHEGILELPPELAPGQDFARAAGLDDTLLDLETPFNRGDLLCLRGLAREVSAALDLPVRSPLRPLPVRMGPLPGVAAVEIQDAADCPRYAARVVRRLRVGPSPAWLRSRLEGLGMRSINNVVDATNFTLLELGQPIHAFDLSKVRGARIVVRRARPEEKLRTLDGVDRVLNPEVLVIADAEQALALAGLMGGESSEVQPGTTEVLLESACFSPVRVRIGSRALKLHSEAARRFEHGTDIEAVPEALDRVASLLAEVAGGEIVEDHLDVYPGLAPPRRVTLRPERVRLITALEVSAERMRAPLARLGFGVEGGGPEGAGSAAAAAAHAIETPFTVSVPSWRVDVLEEIDLIEEIVRSVGYEAIPENAGSITPLFARRSDAERMQARLREAALRLGFHEAITPAMVAPEDVALAPVLPPEARRKPLALANPLSREFSVLRTSLLSGLLRAVSRNARHGRRAVRLFELGHSFLPSNGPLPEEPLELALALFGSRHASGFGLGADRADFHDFKGLLEVLLEALYIDNTEIVSYDSAGFRRGYAAEARAGGQSLGFFGEVDAGALDRLEIPGPTYVASFDAAALARAARPSERFTEWPRFPSVKRDLAFLVALEVEAAALESEIRAAAGLWLREVRLFDLYAGERVPQGFKNLAFSLEFQSLDRTLSDEEVDGAVERVVRQLEERRGARLRT